MNELKIIDQNMHESSNKLENSCFFVEKSIQNQENDAANQETSPHRIQHYAIVPGVLSTVRVAPWALARYQENQEN